MSGFGDFAVGSFDVSIVLAGVAALVGANRVTLSARSGAAFESWTLANGAVTTTSGQMLSPSPQASVVTWDADGAGFVQLQVEPKPDDAMLTRLRAMLPALSLAVVGQQEADAIRTNERQRLAQELHDGVVQELTAIGFRLAALARAEQPSSDAIAALARDLATQQRAIRAVLGR